MKPSYKEGALIFLDSEHYNLFLDGGVDIQKLKLEDSSFNGTKNTGNLIIFFHGANDGRLRIGKRLYHLTDVIQNSRSSNGSTRCFDVFSCHIGTGIQSSHESRQWVEEKYKKNLVEGEYVILNSGNKTTHTILNRAEIVRTIKDGDDKCPPYIRVLRRTCYCPETIKFLYVVKEVNPTTGKPKTKLVTHKFSALKLTPPYVVTLEKIRDHLLSSMERFKNEFLLHIDDEEEKLQVSSEIEKEIERLKEEVLLKDDHLATYGNKTFFLEASRGKFDRVKTYLNQFDINCTVEDGVTPLYIASQEGHSKIVELLLSEGANPNTASSDGVTSLYLASQNGHIKVVNTLLKKMADPNIARNDKETPLFKASYKGHLRIVRSLLEAGADPNKTRYNNVSPIYMASQEGHTQVVEVLLEAGADPYLSCNDNGATPIVAAILNNHIEVVKFLLPKVNLEMCKWLGQDIKELIKSEITNEEEKKDLLDILHSQTNIVLEPTTDTLYGRRKRSSSEIETRPSTSLSIYTVEKLIEESKTLNNNIV